MSESIRRNLGLAAILIALFGIGFLTKPELYGDPGWLAGNIATILQQSAAIGVVTVGMTFVIIGGGIDLSVGAIVALAGVWSTTVDTQGFGAAGMVFTALAVGAGVGLVNGILIAYGRLVAFIATLAMLVAARGLAAQISGKQTQLSLNATINSLTTTKLLGIPLIVLIFAVVAAAGAVLLNRTTFGRRTIAVGGNPEAARLAGINVRGHTMLLYVLSGLCCGIGAVLLTSQATSAQAAMANLYELDAIAAAIIGGTLLSGGRGTITGAIFGVLVFSTITNLFAVNNLSTEAQNMVKGGIIIAAVLVQQIKFGSLTAFLHRQKAVTAPTT
ncbi:ABC transporter [Actinorhabdospora filicis]|uniref:ABC transporter n=1 Tax=Actinorhabdospora filicis TaxID=1785913 RepID=A0A9W6W9W0_9ACTN|nr:ABC transporter permease [Actinorhabdospora filicis]GLZ78398.1 ABC transporter [Actinorhabdospora filicis]